MFKSSKKALFSGILFMFILMPINSFAMHIMESYLPPSWCIFWGLLTLPFLFLGVVSIRKKLEDSPKIKLLLAMAGAFAFVLSALKIPSITGSCSHATGVGLGAILFGPFATSVLGFIVLLFQALLLAHGGLTTLGANTFSMAIAGPIVSYLIFRACKKSNISQNISVFLAAMLGDLMTYVVTSIQLALSFPSSVGGFAASFAKFASIFAITQIPLAISEGILTVIIFNTIVTYSKKELGDLNVIMKEAK